MSAAIGIGLSVRQAPTPSPVVTSLPDHHAAGEAVQAGKSFQITVARVATSQGDATYSPGPGHAFLIADVVLRNTSRDRRLISSLVSFSLRDAAGRQYTETTASGAVPPDGELWPGTSLSGQLVYDVDVNQHDYVLTFDPADGAGVRYNWDVHV